MEDYLTLHNSHNLTSQPASIGVECAPGTSRACGPLKAGGETKKLAHGPRAGKWQSGSPPIQWAPGTQQGLRGCLLNELLDQ